MKDETLYLEIEQKGKGFILHRLGNFVVQIEEEREKIPKERAVGREFEIEASKVSWRRMDGPPANDCCSVCHDNFALPCQANCSHWFCASCIMRVWHFSSALQPCKCPICRRSITLLIPGEAALRQRPDPEAGQVLEQIERYNHLFGGGPHSLGQRLRDLPFFLRRLLRELMDPQRTLPIVFRARMIFAMLLSAIYVLSPIDFLPEGILGIIGMLDDLLIVLIVFLHLTAVYRSTLVFRHGRT